MDDVKESFFDCADTPETLPPELNGVIDTAIVAQEPRDSQPGCVSETDCTTTSHSEKFVDSSDIAKIIPLRSSDPLEPDSSALTSDRLVDIASTEPGTSSHAEDDLDTAQIGPNSKWFIDEGYLADLEKTEKANKLEARQKQALAEKAKGNALYQKGKYEEAAQSYTTALRCAPLSLAEDRSVMYSNRGACFIKMELREQAIDDCTKSLELKPNYIKPLMRRAVLYEEKEDDWDKGLEDYNAVIKLEPNNAAARTAIFRLNPMIQARNEKMKDEMLAKLKDLGNMVLKPFGLSTNNFKMEENQDGGYSVKIQNTK